MADHFTLDLTNYKERQSALVPEGDYLVTVSDTELTKAKESGNAMITMWLRIVAPGKPEDGEVVIDRLVASQKAAFRVVHALKAMGMEPNVGGRLNLNARALIGRTMIVRLVDGEAFRKQVRSEVSEYFADPNASERAAQAPAEDLPTINDDANPEDVGDDLPSLEDIEHAADIEVNVLEVAPTPQISTPTPGVVDVDLEAAGL